MTGDAWKFCHDILPDVSRTFALNIPVLPEDLAPSVCCGYLLCRIADTIEDRMDLKSAERQQLFDLYLRMLGRPEDSEAYGEWLRHWPPDVEEATRRLAVGVPDVLGAYASLPEAHRLPIQECVHEMVEGMRKMIDRPPVEGRVYVCSDLEELERYCHYVAGVVGLMLTRIFRDALGPSFGAPEQLDPGRRFGLGLQLTNILKDQQADFSRGVCFVPREWTDAQGALSAGPKARLIRRTLSHLNVAHDYALGVPGSADKIRLFCLWALWMAVATLREVGRAQSDHPKIGRDEVTSILEFTQAHVRDDEKLRSRYAELHREAEREADRLRASVEVE